MTSAAIGLIAIAITIALLRSFTRRSDPLHQLGTVERYRTTRHGRSGGDPE